MKKKSKLQKDYNGLKLGSLKIESFTGFRDNAGAIFNSTCECGNKREISSRSIRRGIERNYNLSCGKCEYSERLIHLDSEDLALTYLFNMYKGKTKNKLKLEFELSKEEFKILTKKNCYYCNTEPKQVCFTENRKNKYIYNGIDRIDSNKGYEINNVLPCCGFCNRMKLNHTLDAFKEQIKKIYNNLF